MALHVVTTGVHGEGVALGRAGVWGGAADGRGLLGGRDGCREELEESLSEFFDLQRQREAVDKIESNWCYLLSIVTVIPQLDPPPSLNMTKTSQLCQF